MEPGDDAAALEASLIENFARLDPNEVVQWETFTRLVSEGRDVDDIAATFGLAERVVKRVLALGNLLPRIRTLYRDQLIDVATVRHLTMATKAKQKDWLRLYSSPDEYAPTGHRLKEWLFGGQPIATSVALFDPTLYEGAIITDLFGDDSYFADTEAFWRLQRAAVEEKRQAYLSAGWGKVEVLEPGAWFEQWRFDKRAKSKGGLVYLTLSARGEVEVHEGWLPRKEAQKANKAERPKPERPAISRPLQNYIDLHQHAAVRAELTGHPNVALRVMLAHAITGSPLWNVRADPQRADKPATAESVETCQMETLFDEKRRAAIALLEFDAEALTVVGASRDTVAVFERLLPMPDEDVLSILAVVMGETLAVGMPIVGALGSHLEVDMGAVWSADDALFDLVRDKALLLEMIAEVAGPGVAKANEEAKGKVLKGIIRDALDRAKGRPRVGAWSPARMAFPAPIGVID